MDDAFGVGSGGVNGRVQHKTGDVDSKVRCSRIDQIALRMSIDQTCDKDKEC